MNPTGEKKPILAATHLPDGHEKIWILPNHEIVVGRMKTNPADDILLADFDSTLSRKHFTVQLSEDKLVVKRILSSKNLLYFKRKPMDSFQLKSGEKFTVGRTSFYFVLQEIPVDPAPDNEYTFTSDYAYSTGKTDTELKQLFESHYFMIAEFDVREFLKKALSILRKALSMEQEILILSITPSDDLFNNEINIMWRAIASIDHTCAFPSRKLVNQALLTGKPTIHTWRTGSLGKDSYTRSLGQRWACCFPVKSTGSVRYAVYLLGFDESPDEEKIRLVSNITDIINQYFISKKYSQVQFQISNYFSPSIKNNTGNSNPGTGIIEASILSLNIRSFVNYLYDLLNQGRKRKELSSYAYFKLYSKVMNEVTQNLFRHRGVIIDWHDSYLTAGWGLLYQVEDIFYYASEAAVSSIKILQKIFGMQTGFESGIKAPVAAGLAYGPVFEGMIKINGLFKYSLAGQAVERSKQICRLGEHTGMQVLTCEEFVKNLKLNEYFSSRNMYRCAGNFSFNQDDDGIKICEIVPKEDFADNWRNMLNIKNYEKAVDCFQSGDLPECEKYLDKLPEKDSAGRFLRDSLIRAKESGIPKAGEGHIRIPFHFS